MDNGFRLMVAPLQGLTEAAWRRVHFRLFGDAQGAVEYFTPFIRVEHGNVRPRDLRDFTSPLNEGMPVTPQIIFKNEGEWRILVESLLEAGARYIDMNMGCPFPPQVKKGRGAGALQQIAELERIAHRMAQYSGQMEFSIKMRLGLSEPGEALVLSDILNSMPLRHITIHPRTAAQQYKGELHLNELEQLKLRLSHPIIFNGDISTPAQIKMLESGYAGAMVGRGLLSRPTLFAEYRTGVEYSEDDRAGAYLHTLRDTAALLADRLCGPTQLRDKLTPYWQYAPAFLDKKIVKQGKKQGLIP